MEPPCGPSGQLHDVEELQALDPLGYLDFLNLTEGATVVVTDSGSMQEETIFPGLPCLAVRDSTERPVTVELGTNRLVPLDADDVARQVGDAATTNAGSSGQVPPRWDGRAREADRRDTVGWPLMRGSVQRAP